MDLQTLFTLHKQISFQKGAEQNLCLVVVYWLKSDKVIVWAINSVLYLSEGVGEYETYYIIILSLVYHGFTIISIHTSHAFFSLSRKQHLNVTCLILVRQNNSNYCSHIYSGVIT